jgi:hypothetical protein
MVWGSKLLASVEVMSLGVSLMCRSAGKCKEWSIISGAGVGRVFGCCAVPGGFGCGALSGVFFSGVGFL